MSQQLSHHDHMRIAIEARVALNTVTRLYRGARSKPTIVARITEAAERLHLPPPPSQPIAQSA